MAIPSSKSDLLTEFLQALVPPDAKLLQRLPKPLRKSARWMAIGAGTAMLLTWNGRLVLSTGAGLGTIWLVYSMREWGWRAAITDLVNALEGVDRRITLSILAGAGATLGTYTTLSIWMEAQSHWLAVGMILQGAVTMGAIGVLLWQRLQPTPSQTGLIQKLDALTDDDPLQRLIAVRQINHLLTKHPEQRRDVAEFYQVLLTREPDALVQNALMDGLQQMRMQTAVAPAQTQTFQARAKLRRPSCHVHDAQADAVQLEQSEVLLPINAAAPALRQKVQNLPQPAKAFVENFEHN